MRQARRRLTAKIRLEVSKTGTVTLKLQGETQTQDAKHAGQLKLIATQRGKELAHSNGFSVSAIPQDMEFQFLRVIKGDYREHPCFIQLAVRQ